MKDIWEKIITAIKETLEKKFHLNMDGADERLVYLVYLYMMDSKGVRKKPREWISEAHALAPIDYWRDEKCSFLLFQRSIYRSLERAFSDSCTGTFEFFAALQAITNEVKL